MPPPPMMPRVWDSPDQMPPGLVVYVSNLMRMGGSPAYTPIPPAICPAAPPPPQPPSQLLLDGLDEFYAEPIVEKFVRKHRQRLSDQQAQKEKEEAKERAREALEGRDMAERGEGEEGGEEDDDQSIQVVRSSVNHCTPRKIVPKQSNQIVGIKRQRKKEEDEDMADVFKT
mmetsp:Transcript_57088/g.136209  ORF Transcript_57088/g.136209 Transcript_57088/m.136209 type:complete len:171 (-) Transcript_57088:54-566(-)